MQTCANTCSGTLYRTIGPAFDASPWHSFRVTTTPVGTASFRFGTSDLASFDYTLDGGRIAITADHEAGLLIAGHFMPLNETVGPMRR